MIFDSHCHAQFNAFKNDYEEVINHSGEKGVILNIVGTQSATSKRAVEIAERFKNVYASIGLHPVHLFSACVDEEETTFVSREEKFDANYYRELAKSKKVIGIGECGFELFHLPSEVNKEEILKKQKEVFYAQYKLAKELDLTLIIHVRDAHQEMIDFLKEIGAADIRAVIHCFTGNLEEAKEYLNFGFYLGFTGVITFPPRKTNQESTLELLKVVKNIPQDRIVAETDAPYLAPQAYRGKRAEPWMVEEVVKKIAEIREKNFEDISETIFQNTVKLFGIKVL